IAWGDKDPYFLPEGAKAYKRDIPDAIVKLYDRGHLALETHVKEIARDILDFLLTLPDQSIGGLGFINEKKSSVSILKFRYSLDILCINLVSFSADHAKCEKTNAIII